VGLVTNYACSSKLGSGDVKSRGIGPGLEELTPCKIKLRDYFFVVSLSTSLFSIL
jgi:hypothetical protein